MVIKSQMTFQVLAWWTTLVGTTSFLCQGHCLNRFRCCAYIVKKNLFMTAFRTGHIKLHSSTRVVDDYSLSDSCLLDITSVESMHWYLTKQKKVWSVQFMDLFIRLFELNVIQFWVKLWWWIKSKILVCVVSMMN